MVNLNFELERLRATLRSRGIAENTIEQITNKARLEILSEFQTQAESAMELAVEAGVQKDSVDFINEIRPNAITMELMTDSGNLEFSEPPYPMLPWLLKNAKPMKDGSGVYKVIPVGAPSKNPKPSMAGNIFDAQKAIMTARAEEAKRQYDRVKPKGSKATFRTASSKQSAETKWVKPAKEADFTEEVKGINNELSETMEQVIQRIIESYVEAF